MKSILKGLIFLLPIFTIACDNIPQTGMIKDITSHITTNYTNIKPEEVFIYMNEERCNHNQIPLGHEFQLVNNKIKGLKVKDGKVSVGGSMKISDKKGKVLLEIKDLFGENNVFEKDSVTFLRATISTGSPMEYDSLYDVTINYWDNYGTGTLENKMEIEIIDLP